MDLPAEAETEKAPRIVWAPQSGPQKALIDCPLGLIGFGGARGGGKTDGVLGKYAIKEAEYGSSFNAVFFRKEMPQQDDLIERAKEIYMPTGARWFDQKKMFLLPHGGRVRFRPLETVADAEKYQGQSLTDAAVEEAGNYETAAPIDRLFGCLRSKAGVPIQLILTFNPGGPGNDWIRERFVTPYPPGSKRLVQRLRNGNAFEYTFIRSFVANNKILLQNDPGYVDRLHLVGSDALVKAWLEGDFNQIESAYFSEFGDRHIIPPFPDGPPEHWSRIVGFDWGFDHPFATIFGAVSSGRDDVGREVPYPKGALIIYREICGRRMYNADIAKQILNSGETWDKIAADPSIWAERGGPSIAREFELEGLFVRPADNDRRSGWSQIRRRLATKPPFLYVVSSCTNLIRSLSTLRHSLRDSEDAEKSNGDDPADALRYLCKEYLIESDYKERAPTMGQGKVWVSNYVNSVRNERQRVKI